LPCRLYLRIWFLDVRGARGCRLLQGRLCWRDASWEGAWRHSGLLSISLSLPLRVGSLRDAAGQIVCACRMLGRGMAGTG